MAFRKSHLFNTTSITVWTVFLAILISVLALIGWIFDIDLIKSLHVGHATMKVNTAFGIIFIGASLLLHLSEKYRRSARILGLMVLLVGMVTAWEYWFSWNSGIDNILVLDTGSGINPGRISPIATIIFVLFGCALLFYSGNVVWRSRIVNGLVLLTLILSFVAFCGYLFGVSDFYKISEYASLAINTTIAFLFLAIGFLFSRPETGFVSVYNQNSRIARIGIRQLLFIVGILIIVSWFRLKGEESGLFSSQFGLSIMIISFVIIFTTLSWYSVRQLSIAQEKINKSEENYRSLFEQASDAIFISDEKGNILDVNTKACQLLGYNKRILRQKQVFDLFGEEELKQHPIMEKELRAGETTFYERNMVHKEGQTIPVEITARMNSDGRFMAIARDVAERKKAETALRESEELYRTLIERISDGFISVDNNWNLIYANKKSGELFRREPHSLIGKNVWNEFPGALESETYKAYHKAFTEQKYIRNTDYYSPLDLWLENHIYPTPDGLSVFIRDITEQKRFERALKESELFSKSILMSLTSHIGVVNESGEIISVNKAWTNFADQYGPTTLERCSAGSNYFEVCRKEADAGDQVAGNVSMALQKILRHEIPFYETEYSCHTPEKEQWFLLRITPFADNTPKAVMVHINITEGKEAEDLLMKSYEDIRRLASHLEQVREEERIGIAREIHDELGQQLTVLKMDISWLNKNLKNLDERALQKMKDLVSIIETTIKTVRRISSELRPSILDDLGLVPAMEWQCKEFEKRSGVKAEILGDIGDLDLTSKAATGLFRIFQESLTNVARHSESSKVKVSLAIKAEQIIMKIQDNGKGFDTTILENKKTLGILGMRERVHLLGGRYKISSAPGEGTQIEVKVPVSSIT